MDFPLFNGATGTAQNNQTSAEENAATSQFNGTPFSAASFNAMMAGGQLQPPGNHGFPQSLAQYSTGMFPSGTGAMFSAPNGQLGFPSNAAMLASGGNGLSLPPSALGLSAASVAMQKNMNMQAAAPYLLSANGSGIPGLAGANPASSPNAAAAAAGASAFYGQMQEDNSATPGGEKPSTALVPVDAQSAAMAQVPKGLPASLLSRYWNLQPNLPSSVVDDTVERPYRDHALMTEDESVRRFGGKESRGGGSNFPSKLHEILSRSDISDIISWSPHGRSWRVFKPKAFEEKVIPQYFRHCKYNSFTRQVNGWGFRRITQGPDHNAYFHEMFLRGLPHLCKRMRRLTASGASRSDAAASIEPDFYSISKISPLPAIGNGAQAPIKPDCKKPTGATGAEDSAKAAAKKNGPPKKTPTNPKQTKEDAEFRAELDASNAAAAAATAAAPDIMSQLSQLKDPNEYPTMDMARQQFLQAQYLNAVNAAPGLFQRERPPIGSNGLMSLRQDGQDTLQQQILAQQALLTSLQNQQGALSQFGGMSLPGSQMYMAAAPGSALQMPSSQGNVLNNPANPNGFHPGGNVQYY